MKHFRPYLWGKQFEAITDHRALQWLYNTKDTNERLYRWFLKLTRDGYDYTIHHRAGQEHGNADGMSRLMCTWDTHSGDTVNIVVEDEDYLQSSTENNNSDVHLPTCKNLEPEFLLTLNAPQITIVEQQEQCRITSELRKFVLTGELPKDIL